MTGTLLRRGNLDPEIETHTGRMPYDQGGRNWSDRSINQGMPKTVDSSQKLREGHGTDSPLEPPVGTNPVNTWILDS